MSRRDEYLRKEFAKKTTYFALQKWQLATVMALHKELGFGDKRMKRMLKAIEKEVESITSGWIGFEDYKE